MQVSNRGLGSLEAFMSLDGGSRFKCSRRVGGRGLLNAETFTE